MIYLKLLIKDAKKKKLALLFSKKPAGKNWYYKNN